MDTTTVQVGTHAVHSAVWTAPEGGAASSAAPEVVCAHGLGGSHLNWSLMAPLLAASPQTGPRVWSPDLSGFGLTPPQTTDGRDVGSGLDANTALLADFIRTASPGKPVTLIGNSMGGLLAIRVAARHPDLIAGLVLVNPAVPAPIGRATGRALDREVVANFALMALPKLGELALSMRQRRLTPRQQVLRTMELCVADPAALSEDVLDSHTQLAALRRAMPHAHQAFLQAARGIVKAHTLDRAALWADVDAVQAPTLYVQGAQDRLVRPAAGELLLSRRPDWALARYEQLGHIPMIEAPEQLARDISAWLEVTARDSSAT